KPLAPEVRVAVSEVRAAHRANPSSTAGSPAPLASSAPQPDAPFARPARATELATRSLAPFAAWRAPPSALASELATGCPGLRVRASGARLPSAPRARNSEARQPPRRGRPSRHPLFPVA